MVISFVLCYISWFLLAEIQQFSFCVWFWTWCWELSSCTLPMGRLVLWFWDKRGKLWPSSSEQLSQFGILDRKNQRGTSYYGHGRLLKRGVERTEKDLMCVAKIHQVSGLLAQMISIFGTLGSSFRGGGLRACEGRARLQSVWRCREVAERLWKPWGGPACAAGEAGCYRSAAVATAGPPRGAEAQRPL